MARRDRNAALAGLAALGALMYARSRKEKGGESEEVKPIRTATAAPKDEGFKTLEDAPQSEKGAMAPAKPAAPAPVKPAAPAAGAGRSAGVGGPTAAQMAQAAMGAGGGRGGQGGPRIGEREAYAAAQQRTAPGEIPGQTAKAPASTGESTSGMSNFDKLTAGIPAGMGATRFLQAGARGLANVMRGREAMAQTAQANAKRIGEGQRMLESPGAMKQRGLDAARAERAAERKVETPDVINLPGKNAGMTAQDRMREMKMGRYRDDFDMPLKKGGKAKVKKMASGGMAKSSVSKRADGIAKRGKTRGKMY